MISRMRDIEIEREGTGWDTDYTVEWVDEKDVAAHRRRDQDG